MSEEWTDTGPPMSCHHWALKTPVNRARRNQEKEKMDHVRFGPTKGLGFVRWYRMQPGNLGRFKHGPGLPFFLQIMQILVRFA